MNLFSYLKSSISILDVIKEYATLKKAGSYWKGSCPFHSEKTASFTVSPHKEIFYCFGCHSGGDLITFTAKVENCSPLEAAQHLIERYQITLPDSISHDKSNSLEKRNLHFKIYQAVAQWCVYNLTKNPSISHYLYERGINQESINYFNVGFFPGGLASMRAFTDAMKKESILPHDLLQAHIIAQGKTIMYSPFENRIIFPIKDHLGRFCGFGGRIYQPQDERAKYYNSRETEFFIKGSLLFGLDKAKSAIQSSEQAFLVEGYTDCIAMVQHGFLNTVATLGTACTIEHLTILARYAQQLFVVYDSDKAGHEAILRLTELCWQVNLELKVICLPSGEDPASFLKQNKTLDPLIKEAKDIFEFFIMAVGTGFSEKTLSKKIHLTQKIVSLIKNVDEPLKQEILLQRASKVLDLSILSLQKSTGTAPIAPPFKENPRPIPASKEDQSADQKLEKKIFFAIMNNLSLLNNENVNYLLEYLPTPLNDIVQALQKAREQNTRIDFVQFFDQLKKNEQDQISQLLVEFDQEVLLEEFDQLLIKLQKKNWKQIVHSIKKQLAYEEEQGNKEKIEKIMQRFLELKRTIVHKNLI